MTTIQNSSVLVTGAGHGLGREIATELALEDARLTLWDPDPDLLEDVIQTLQDVYAADVEGWACDVADREAVRDCARRTEAARGPIEIVVNTEREMHVGSLLALSDDEIARSFAVNSLALFWTTRAFLPGMIERGRGHIVTVSSAAGLVGTPMLADYSASKWAAVGFDEALRRELHETAPGVRTTVVCPFLTRSSASALRTRYPWILPVLRDEKVAERVVQAIEHDESRVSVPSLLSLASPLRALPVGVLDWVAGRLAA